MPAGFTYIVLSVAKNTCVTTVSIYPAILMRDELDNSYKYLHLKLNPTI
jgi:hypothetical protein